MVVVFLLSMVLAPVERAEPVRPVATDDVGPVAFGPAVPPIDGQERPPAPGPAVDATRAFPSVRFRWPLLMTGWWHTSNYVDLQPAPGSSGCSTDSHLHFEVEIQGSD